MGSHRLLDDEYELPGGADEFMYDVDIDRDAEQKVSSTNVSKKSTFSEVRKSNRQYRFDSIRSNI